MEDKEIVNHLLNLNNETLQTEENKESEVSAIPYAESQSPSSLKKVYGVKHSNLDRFLAPVLKKPLLFIDIDIEDDEK